MVRSEIRSEKKRKYQQDHVTAGAPTRSVPSVAPKGSLHWDPDTLSSTCTHWAVYNRADLGSFPVIENSLVNNDLCERCEVSRIKIDGGGDKRGASGPGSVSSG